VTYICENGAVLFKMCIKMEELYYYIKSNKLKEILNVTSRSMSRGLSLRDKLEQKRNNFIL
jgi:hypothetical protein